MLTLRISALFDVGAFLLTKNIRIIIGWTICLVGNAQEKETIFFVPDLRQGLCIDL